MRRHKPRVSAIDPRRPKREKAIRKGYGGLGTDGWFQNEDNSKWILEEFAANRVDPLPTYPLYCRIYNTWIVGVEPGLPAWWSRYGNLLFRQDGVLIRWTGHQWKVEDSKCQQETMTFYYNTVPHFSSFSENMYRALGIPENWISGFTTPKFLPVHGDILEAVSAIKRMDGSQSHWRPRHWKYHRMSRTWTREDGVTMTEWVYAKVYGLTWHGRHMGNLKAPTALEGLSHIDWKYPRPFKWPTRLGVLRGFADAYTG